VQKLKRSPQNVQPVLDEELARLKKLVPFEEDLTVQWKPLSQSTISGKVIGTTVYVYDEDPQEALNTLRHEYLDCLLTRKLVNPLVTLVNTFIKLREKEIYMEKERIVTHLLRLV
jgi:hypothetical protein